MNVGIIIHSHTGNTLSVAQILNDKILKLGHAVKIEQVKAINEDPSAVKSIELKDNPQINDYDVLVFGAPVRAFSLSPVMKTYLMQLDSLKGKKVGIFVTQQLPYSFMGGNRSIKQMKSICEAKGDPIFKSSIINWSRKERDKRIEELTETYSELL